MHELKTMEKGLMRVRGEAYSVEFSRALFLFITNLMHEDNISLIEAFHHAASTHSLAPNAFQHGGPSGSDAARNVHVC
jgi:hypothetical protein